VATRPGAFFRAENYIGDRKRPARVKLVSKEGFIPAVREAAILLQARSPGALVVFGADSASPERSVLLPSGHKVALCSCFDLFGICGDAAMPGQARLADPGFVRIF